jgi:hypothetical protein
MTRSLVTLVTLGFLAGCCGGKDKAEQALEAELAKAEEEAEKMAAEAEAEAENLEKELAEAEAEAAMPELSKTFTSHEQLGYTIKYPEHWMVNADSPLNVIMGGDDESKSDYSMALNIQGIQKEGDETMEEKVEHEVKHMTEQVSALPEGKVEELDPLDYKDAGGDTRKARTFKLTFKGQDTLVNKWVVIIPGASPNIVWSYSYQETSENFEKNMPLAQAVFETLSLSK